MVGLPKIAMLVSRGVVFFLNDLQSTVQIEADMFFFPVGVETHECFPRFALAITLSGMAGFNDQTHSFKDTFWGATKISVNKPIIGRGRLYKELPPDFYVRCRSCLNTGSQWISQK